MSEARPDQVDSGGRGRGQQGRGRGNQGRGRGGRNRGGTTSKFEGQEPLLKGCIFDYAEDSQAKRYLKT